MEDNIKIKINLKIRREGVDWIHVCQDRDTMTAVVTTVIKFQLP
jgi:hypothetical protein